MHGLARYGGIEAGGTKFVCAIGTGPDDLETAQFPTTSPEETIGRTIEFFRTHPPHAIGIASFGPLDLRTGDITSTPKLSWRNVDLVGRIRQALGVPVALDTDVNGAALGEARYGAARGLSDFVYLTVGTGIGGGAMVNGQLLHGDSHPEMGHIQVPHDRARDPFPGCCPYHGDCLEGLASGPAIESRWGASAAALPPEHPAWALEARYLAVAIANLAFVLSPQRIVAGGGVLQQTHLYPLIREELDLLLGGYLHPPEIVPPELGLRAGVLGALVLAETAAS